MSQLPVTVRSGEAGTYQVTVLDGVGPEFDGCIIVEATAGGATARVQQPVHYASGYYATNNATTVDLALPPAQPLTRAEADRLIEVLRRAIRTEQDAVEEISLYSGVGLAEAYQLVEPLARHLRGVDSVRLVSEGDRRFTYTLHGRREPPLEVTVAQDSLTRIEWPAIQQ